MVTEIRVYFEGDERLKPGFNVFFSFIRKQAWQKQCEFRLVATGGSPDQDFGKAIRSHPHAWNILLKDSEGPDWQKRSAALCEEKGWNEGSVFWMVEMMESWFHADKDALAAFYGRDFNRDALKANRNVEEISKKDLRDGLSAATRKTGKGNYFDHKASHAAELLSLIKPDMVKKWAPNCRRLFETVLAKLQR